MTNMNKLICKINSLEYLRASFENYSKLAPYFLRSNYFDTKTNSSELE